MAENDYHLRYHVIETGFSQEDDQIYEQAMAHIKAEVTQGRTWVRITKDLPVADPELKNIILDDFLKISIAEQHFRDGLPLGEVARTLRLPEKQLRNVKKAMLKEVEDASVKAYHLQQAIEEQKKQGSAH
jgi:hypothetical protein